MGEDPESPVIGTPSQLTALVILWKVPKCFVFSLFTCSFTTVTLKEKLLIFLTPLLLPDFPHLNFLSAMKSYKNKQDTGSNECLWMSISFPNLVILKTWLFRSWLGTPEGLGTETKVYSFHRAMFSLVFALLWSIALHWTENQRLCGDLWDTEFFCIYIFPLVVAGLQIAGAIGGRQEVRQ